MSEVEKWIEGQSVKIVASALFLAKSAPEVSEALIKIRYHEDSGLELPPLSTWLSFYNHHRKIVELLSELFH